MWLVEGAAHRKLGLAADGVVGDLYLPAVGAPPGRQGVLLIAGSDGLAPRFHAALLASRGYPALAVRYFGAPGLPEALRDVPVEYFAAAAGVLPSPVTVIGMSRGGEAALLLSGLYPELIRSTVVLASNDSVRAGFPDGGNAWTFRGRPQTVIPYDSIDDPVLAVAGTDDGLFNAAPAALTIERQTSGEALLYFEAGHAISIPPYLPVTSRYVHPVTGDVFDLGGTRSGDASARHQSWHAMLRFLADA
jgi:dienelactone hydrolase